MKRFRVKYWILPVILFVALMAAFRSGAFSSAKNQPPADDGVVNVQIKKIQYVSMTPQLKLDGSIEGQTAAAVSAKIAGRIETVLVHEGQSVKAGDPLVKLESVEQANSVRTARDAVTKVKINYDFAAADYKRYKKLYDLGAISEQQLETADAKLKSSQADLSSASASLNSAEQQYGYGVITAPVDGVVANKTATVGQVVSPGTPLMVVENINTVYAVVNIEQEDLGRVQAGQKAAATVDAYPGKIFDGLVERMNPAASTANRMFRTKIRINNTAGLLKPGMFTKVQLATGEAVRVLTVPQAAVVQKQGLYYVFTLENNKAVRHPVDVGAVTGDSMVIKSGLKAGDSVLISNVNQLKDGDAVQVAEQVGKNETDGN
ncbi:rtx secretion protein d gram-negative bacteria [Lucifera butyrica]|uniref:Rtx secretion protein d gram-negative bacteria n=1 Tax=Lucifera butyrica TaxID=1351585 RepID=A0A498RDS2_9FIRM|nr:efflux RND transporter periplasmic adaptor subunit [Lucifera butyrica]VBB09644.1 rtx secretion protein d gram-negative bacteria [Lucifera butyrica]